MRWFTDQAFGLEKPDPGKSEQGSFLRSMARPFFFTKLLLISQSTLKPFRAVRALIFCSVPGTSCLLARPASSLLPMIALCSSDRTTCRRVLSLSFLARDGRRFCSKMANPRCDQRAFVLNNPCPSELACSQRYGFIPAFTIGLSIVVRREGEYIAFPVAIRGGGGFKIYA
jgi:hypothetical protein